MFFEFARTFQERVIFEEDTLREGAMCGFVEGAHCGRGSLERGHCVGLWRGSLWDGLFGKGA